LPKKCDLQADDRVLVSSDDQPHRA
jgi:hypothetical protein